MAPGVKSYTHCITKVMSVSCSAVGETRRAKAVARRRAQLIEAARELLVSQGFHRLSLEEVARGAGVTRKTVYNHFGSKLGLLGTIFDAVATKGEIWRLMESAELPDLREAVTRAAEASCRLWSSDRELLRRLVGLAALDPDIAAVVMEREQRREATWARLVQRLAAAGMLRSGISPEQAVRALMALTSFATFDTLTPPDAPPEVTVELLRRLLDGIVDLSGSG